MPTSVYQALTCYMAARSLTELTAKSCAPRTKVMDFDVHSVANGMDCCTSYHSYKYANEDVKERIEEHFKCPKGSGIYGVWRFKDGTSLYVMCDHMFCIETTEQTFIDPRAWPKLVTFELKTTEVVEKTT